MKKLIALFIIAGALLFHFETPWGAGKKVSEAEIELFMEAMDNAYMSLDAGEIMKFYADDTRITITVPDEGQRRRVTYSPMEHNGYDSGYLKGINEYEIKRHKTKIHIMDDRRSAKVTGTIEEKTTARGKKYRVLTKGSLLIERRFGGLVIVRFDGVVRSATVF